MPVAEGNVGLAFGLVIAAGLSTTIGSTFVFCSSYANTKALAAALGVSAGVMLYVSFVEIFAIKAVQGFTAAHGEKYGGVYATLAFFGGIAATTGLDALVHAIGRYQRDRGVDKTKTFSQNETGTDEGDSPTFASLDSGANKNTENASVLGGCACAWASEGGFEDMKNLKKLRTSSHKKTSGKGKSPKHGTDPADMLAGERALWSDAAAATQEENDFNASHAHAHAGCDAHACDVETGGGGSSASSTTSVSGTPLKRATDFGILEKDPDMSKPGIESMHASQVGLLTSVKHGVTPQFDTENKEHLKNMGLMTAVAIGLHNFPEGLATFVAALADMKLGIALAVAVAVHNIPEGMCVAMPVYYATGSKWKGFWWSFVSGISEPIGGVFGYLVLYGNGMSDEAYGALFGVVGGMMVYISLKELLPTALKYDRHDQYVTNCMFAGMAVMALSLILFQI